MSAYVVETCSEEGHVPGCAGKAGGDHEFVTVRLNAMRCTVCGHRLDSFGGCDSCAADREAEQWEVSDGD